MLPGLHHAAAWSTLGAGKSQFRILRMVVLICDVAPALRTGAFQWQRRVPHQFHRPLRARRTRIPATTTREAPDSTRPT